MVDKEIEELIESLTHDAYYAKEVLTSICADDCEVGAIGFANMLLDGICSAYDLDPIKLCDHMGKTITEVWEQQGKFTRDLWNE